MEDGVVLRGVYDNQPIAILSQEAGVGTDFSMPCHLSFVFALCSPHIGKETSGTHPGGRAVGTFPIGVCAVWTEIENLQISCMEDTVDALQDAQVIPASK